MSCKLYITLLGWIAITYFALNGIMNNPPYELETVEGVAKNVVCKTEYSWDYNYCHMNVLYKYNEVEYRGKTFMRVEDIPQDGDQVKIEIRKEQPSYVIHPYKNSDRYKNGILYTMALTFTIMISLFVLIVGIFVFFEYILQNTSVVTVEKATIKKSN